MIDARTMPTQPRWRVYLRLGRVSNLPTIWTNCLAGMLLAGAIPEAASFALLALGISFLYVAGMFLNDAFDQEFDNRYRRERPIPSGEIDGFTVYGIGFGLMVSGLIVLFSAAWMTHHVTRELVLWAIFLCVLIVYYDSHHKNNPASPVFMGLCRVLVYLSAAAFAGSAGQPAVLIGAGCLLA